VDERNYIIDTVQLMIFNCDDCAFSMHVDLASLCGLNGTVTGKYLFLKIKIISSLEDCSLNKQDWCCRSCLFMWLEWRCGWEIFIPENKDIFF
jgi:hypothetical protein